MMPLEPPHLVVREVAVPPEVHAGRPNPVSDQPLETSLGVDQRPTTIVLHERSDDGAPFGKAPSSLGRRREARHDDRE